MSSLRVPLVLSTAATVAFFYLTIKGAERGVVFGLFPGFTFVTLATLTTFLFFRRLDAMIPGFVCGRHGCWTDCTWTFVILLGLLHFALCVTAAVLAGRDDAYHLEVNIQTMGLLLYLWVVLPLSVLPLFGAAALFLLFALLVILLDVLARVCCITGIVCLHIYGVCCGNPSDVPGILARCGCSELRRCDVWLTEQCLEWMHRRWKREPVMAAVPHVVVRIAVPHVAEAHVAVPLGPPGGPAPAN